MSIKLIYYLGLFFIMCCHSTIQAQSLKIKGKTQDSSGKILSGVSVNSKKSKIYTKSDDLGQYTIETLPGDTILFSMVGYTSFHETVTVGKAILNVTLLKDDKLLDEVVVVGYGSQNRSKITGAVATVKFDQAMENRPVTNASQALSGQVSGLWVSQNSGKPGSDGAQIRVRGWGTMNNSDPLVLIDGIEGAISQVNPNDIASMTVLKDAASAAIYGSKAANGVILITTKTGSDSESARISLGTYRGFQSLGKRFSIIDNSAEYMQLWNQALINAGGSALFSDAIIGDFRKGGDTFKYPNTNFFDEVFHVAPIQEHNFSVRGGSKSTKFYLSANYLEQDGIMLSTSAQRYGLTANVESKIKDWLTVGGRMNGMMKKSEEPYDLGRVFYIFSNGAYPFTAPYTADGKFGAPQTLKDDGSPIVGNRNPLIETANGRTLNEESFLKMNAYVNISPLKNLKFSSNFSSQTTNNLQDRYNQLVQGFTDGNLAQLNLDYPTQLAASRSNVRNLFYTWYNSLDYKLQINDVHDLDLLVGSQIESSNMKNVFGRRTNPPKEGLTQIDAGTSGFGSNGNMTDLRLFSYFGRLNYSYNNRYLFESNLRMDASSRFKEGSRRGYFPSFSGGWILSEEDFMKDQQIVNTLKLRASWGKLGNQNINNFWPYLTSITQTNAQSYNYGGQFAPGAAITALVDPFITWESTATTNFGMDVGLFNNKVQLEAEYFIRNTNDIIVQLPIPQLLGGVSAPFENVGKMKNEGIEFNVSYKNNPKDGRLGYKISGNISYTENLVTKFRENAPDQLYLIREGVSYRSLYGFNSIGIYQSDEEAKAHMKDNGYLPRAGELKFEDVNADGKLDYQDKKVLGNTIPKFTYGMTFDFNYKGFDLNILLQGVGGVKGYTQSSWTQPLGISGGIITERWRDSWTPENKDAALPSIRINNTWTNNESSFWVSDLSFLKIRNIQLGYTVPSLLCSKIGLKTVSLYANAQNFFTISDKNYEGFDPERNTFDSGGSFYPLPRILTFGLNLSL